MSFPVAAYVTETLEHVRIRTVPDVRCLLINSVNSFGMSVNNGRYMPSSTQEVLLIVVYCHDIHDIPVFASFLRHGYRVIVLG